MEVQGSCLAIQGHYQHWVGAQQPQSSPQIFPALASSFCHTAAGWPHAGDTGWLQSQLSSQDQS